MTRVALTVLCNTAKYDAVGTVRLIGERSDDEFLFAVLKLKSNHKFVSVELLLRII